MNEHNSAVLALCRNVGTAAVLLAAGCGGGEATRAQVDKAHELVIIGGETRADGEKGGYARTGGEITSNPGPTIRVKVGEQVTIVFDNVHGVHHGETYIPHDFAVVADKNIDVPLAQGAARWGAQTKEIDPSDPVDRITFTPDKAGTYYYICSIPGHVERGMWGRFVVEG